MDSLAYRYINYPSSSDEFAAAEATTANYNASIDRIAALERYNAQLEQCIVGSSYSSPSPLLRNTSLGSLLVARRADPLVMMRATRPHITSISSRNMLAMHYRMAAQRQQQREQQQQQQQHSTNAGVGRGLSFDIDYNRRLHQRCLPYSMRTPSPSTSPVTPYNTHDGNMPPPARMRGDMVPSAVPSSSLQTQIQPPATMDDHREHNMPSTNTNHTRDNKEEDTESDLPCADASFPTLKQPVSTTTIGNYPHLVPTCCSLRCNPAVVSCYRDFSRPLQREDPQHLSHATTFVAEQPKKKGNYAVSRKSFPFILMEILSREDISDIISWCPHGRAWLVHKPDTFAEDILSQHFRHSKFNSFMRQVNGWGFQRIHYGKDQNAYYHEKFLHGWPHYLVKEMRRNAAPCICLTPPDFYRMRQIAEPPHE